MDDEATLAELRQLFTRVEPVPERLQEAARAAFTWRTIDAELAELMADSAEEDVGALALRGAAGPRRLSFESPAVAIEAEVTVTGPAQRRLVGQILPPAPPSPPWGGHPPPPGGAGLPPEGPGDHHPPAPDNPARSPSGPLERAPP